MLRVSCTALAFGVLFLYSPGTAFLHQRRRVVDACANFCEDAFFNEGRGRGFYRRPLLGFISGKEKNSRNEVRDIIRPNYEFHTMHFVPFVPLDKKEGSI